MKWNLSKEPKIGRELKYEKGKLGKRQQINCNTTKAVEEHQVKTKMIFITYTGT